MPLADPSLKATLPQYIPTPIHEIPSIVDRARSTFHEGRTRPLSFRITQLQKLYYGLCDIESTAIAASSADLGRAHFETFVADIGLVKSDVLKTIQNLKTWLADEYVTEGISWIFRFGHRTYLKKDPMGVVLVIGAWNFPWNLCLLPFIGAMAAGNTCILKPSEIAPYTAAVLEKLFEVSGIDSECYRVVQGGVPESTELLKQQFDKIFYTGNTQVGKVVMKAAAEFLTPVVLELGGKNPTVIGPSAQVPVAARRIAWAKTFNCGQCCTSPDYLIIHSSLESAFITELSKVLKQFFPTGFSNSKDYSRIVNDRHFKRLHDILKTTVGEVKLGGEIIDPSDLMMETTLISLGHATEGKWKFDSTMQQEIFGPLLPYITYDTIDQALDVARQMSDTALGAYVFTEDKAEQLAVLEGTRSGGFCINEAFMNSVMMSMPFGGVGQSGMGAYRGRYSIESFLHKRPVVDNKGGWVDWLLAFRFPPFLDKNYRMVMTVSPRAKFSRPAAESKL